MKDEFRETKVRPPALAGHAYSIHPPELLSNIQANLKSGGLVYHRQLSESLIALIAPHIDYLRGGPAYGITYRHMQNNEHDLYILLGTAHQYSKHLFHLSSKHFSTPLGTLECDRDFVGKLARRYGADRSFADEYLHRRKHSLELQFPFLQASGCPARIVPLLVGSFHFMLSKESTPSNNEAYESFVEALAELLKERMREGSRICFIAGVDMAHVGKNFGDTKDLSRAWMEEVEQRDKEYLEAVKALDHKRLLDHVAQDGDQRRLCGFPTMYTLLDVLSRLPNSYRVEIFDYRQAVNHETQCAVTFAGAGIYTVGKRS